MDAAGMRGVRFNFLPRLVDATDPEMHLALARRVAKLGWHVVVYFEAPSLQKMIPFLEALPTVVVLDHMSLPDAAKGRRSSRFSGLFTDGAGPSQYMGQGDRAGAHLAAAARLMTISCRSPKALVERFPDRVLWGTDWPHPNMTTHMPDDGVLVDMIPRIAPTASLQKALLVDNPMRLYWER